MEPSCDSLCEFCACITEENTRFSYGLPQEEMERRVFPHQPHIQALYTSGLQGCLLCRLIFEAFRTQCQVSDAELHLAISQIASGDYSALPSRTDKQNNGGWYTVNDPTEEFEDPPKHMFQGRIPIAIRYDPNLEERIVVYDFRSKDNDDCGRIFISRDSSRPFWSLHAVMSGRPSEAILQVHMSCTVDVYTQNGKHNSSNC